MTSVHDMCMVAQRAEDCAFCGVQPGQPCTADRPGVHLCRICKATTDGLFTMLDAATVIHDRDVFTGGDLVLDEEAAA